MRKCLTPSRCVAVVLWLAMLVVPLSTRAQGPTGKAKSGQVRTNSIGMKLATIPAGEFLMGTAGNTGSELQHRVRITKPFEMGVYEVTQAEYQKVMGTNPSAFSASGVRQDSRTDKVTGLDTTRFPVELVSWEDAQEFCRRLSKKENRQYRLPTEAEWEYACRAGTTTEYYTGDGERALAEAGWYGDNAKAVGNSEERTHGVGQKKPNAFGLYDMHGNVFEWCSDWYGEGYYLNSPVNPQGPSTGSLRVYRGGGWTLDADSCRSANRRADVPSFVYASVGFRVALVPSSH